MRAALIIGALLMLPAAMPHAQEMDRGEMLSLSCAACHGPEAKGAGAIPALQGQSLAYIRNRMLAFKSGERQATVMGRIATGYSEEEIIAMARYLSSLKPTDP
ncbi:c-type cytochrome [Minwuia sp.]|uniref:c-type cytochrome n=1 Tax=Minwuia sp. TaxID=2493630 RepID=UPI003A939355